MRVSIIALLIIFVSCRASHPIDGGKEKSISLTAIECGSLEVRNHGSSIGFAMNQFVTEVENKQDEITDFEISLQSSYGSSYSNFLRVYRFTMNSGRDTILNVIMLRPKFAHSIPSWQCEEQDVDTYFRSKKYPRMATSVTYNCTKDRFKIPGDPD